MNHRIFIIEDHDVVRDALAELVRMEPDLTVCGTAANGEEALESLEEADADLALVDVSLPSMSGIELVRHLRRRMPSLKTLIVSGHDSELYRDHALAAGASGYIMKEEAVATLAHEIRLALVPEGVHTS